MIEGDFLSIEEFLLRNDEKRDGPSGKEILALSQMATEIAGSFLLEYPSEKYPRRFSVVIEEGENGGRCVRVSTALPILPFQDDTLGCLPFITMYFDGNNGNVLKRVCPKGLEFPSYSFDSKKNRILVDTQSITPGSWRMRATIAADGDSVLIESFRLRGSPLIHIGYGLWRKNGFWEFVAEGMSFNNLLLDEEDFKKIFPDGRSIPIKELFTVAIDPYNFYQRLGLLPPTQIGVFCDFDYSRDGYQVGFLSADCRYSCDGYLNHLKSEGNFLAFVTFSTGNTDIPRVLEVQIIGQGIVIRGLDGVVECDLRGKNITPETLTNAMELYSKIILR